MLAFNPLSCFSPRPFFPSNISSVVYTQVLVTQLCLTLCDPMDCSSSGSSVHGILQARVLEWVAISFSKKMFGSVHFSSVTQVCPTLCDPMNRSMRGLPVHHKLPEFTQTHVRWVGDGIQLSHPLLSLSPPALNLCIIRVFSNESALCIRWPKCWSFSFNISLFQGISGLISFKIDWFDLIAVQGTLKSLLQHHSWKASILRRSAFEDSS